MNEFLILLKKLSDCFINFENLDEPFVQLKELVDEMSELSLKMYELSSEDFLVASHVLKVFNSQVDLIYLLYRGYDNALDYDIENLRIDFKDIEVNHFNIINSYILGTIKKNDINEFEHGLSAFREKLYGFKTNEDNLLEIAKMKSKVQHFYTEVLEDEDVLKVAFNNEK